MMARLLRKAKITNGTFEPASTKSIIVMVESFVGTGTWWMLVQRVEDYSCLYLQQLTLAALIARMFPTGLSLANLTVVSLDRCYALCRPFAYRAKVTKRGNAFSFSRTIFVHCGGKQSKFESSKFIFGSEADRRLIERFKTKEIPRDSGMKKVIVPFILGAKYEYQK